MDFQIKEIQPEDDAAVCQIIKQVGEEFGAVGEGYGPSDGEVVCMSQHYNDSTRSRYLVAKVDGVIVGGGGIAALSGAKDVAELKKLFLLPESRGLGIGRALAEDCLAFAQAHGYRRCYLDTLCSMKSAIALYEELGFQRLDQPFASSEHNGCDVWMLKELVVTD